MTHTSVSIQSLLRRITFAFTNAVCEIRNSIWTTTQPFFLHSMINFLFQRELDTWLNLPLFFCHLSIVYFPVSYGNPSWRYGWTICPYSVNDQTDHLRICSVNSSSKHYSYLHLLYITSRMDHFNIRFFKCSLWNNELHTNRHSFNIFVLFHWLIFLSTSVGYMIRSFFHFLSLFKRFLPSFIQQF